MAERKEGKKEAKEKKVEKKGKKVRTGKKHSKVDLRKFYSLKDGKLEKTKKSCPRCGAGTFLADHKTRFFCGRCEYTEFLKREIKMPKK